jgi:hypothetical protein
MKLPELSIEIPEKAKKGKNFPHVAELDSQSAKRWQKDGSLVVEIETVVDGEGAPLSPPTAPSSSASTIPPKPKSSNRQ